MLSGTAIPTLSMAKDGSGNTASHQIRTRTDMQKLMSKASSENTCQSFRCGSFHRSWEIQIGGKEG